MKCPHCKKKMKYDMLVTGKEGVGGAWIKYDILGERWYCSNCNYIGPGKPKNPIPNPPWEKVKCK